MEKIKHHVEDSKEKAEKKLFLGFVEKMDSTLSKCIISDEIQVEDRVKVLKAISFVMKLISKFYDISKFGIEHETRFAGVLAKTETFLYFGEKKLSLSKRISQNMIDGVYSNLS